MPDLRLNSLLHLATTFGHYIKIIYFLLLSSN